MVRPVRFELTTFCSGGKRSIQTELRAHNQQLIDTKGSLEPLPSKGELPLHSDQSITERIYLKAVSPATVES